MKKKPRKFKNCLKISFKKTLNFRAVKSIGIMFHLIIYEQKSPKYHSVR